MRPGSPDNTVLRVSTVRVKSDKVIAARFYRSYLNILHRLRQPVCASPKQGPKCDDKPLNNGF
ncbi:hypothetical protein HOE425_332684 [Hoeflea sp. EC-HK425]|nr:hypothetical protein HOE425_332684 [Hoeflea sp. EC-HK425]